MTKRDLKELEYPRHVHKPNREFRHVDNAEQCEAALAEGFTLECPPFPDSRLGMEMAAAAAGEPAPASSSSATDPAPSSPASDKKKKGH